MKKEVTSVIIPTTFRPTLLRAVNSVLSQTVDPNTVQVVIVADLPYQERPEWLDLDRVSVIFTGGKKGASYARNLGCERSDGHWMAYLDDDDEWTKNKLEEQRLLTAGTPGATVVSCRVREADPNRHRISPPLPRLLPSGSISIEDYLFRDRSYLPDRASLITSTLVVRRDLASAIPWDAGLPRHQDWDWLLRASRSESFRLVVAPQALVVREVGTGGSISSSSNWKASLEWVLGWESEWDPQTFADFVAGQCLRYALQARSLTGARACVKEVLRVKRLPNLRPIVLGLAGLLGRHNIEQFLTSRVWSSLRTAGASVVRRTH